MTTYMNSSRGNTTSTPPTTRPTNQEKKFIAKSSKTIVYSGIPQGGRNYCPTDKPFCSQFFSAPMVDWVELAHQKNDSRIVHEVSYINGAPDSEFQKQTFTCLTDEHIIKCFLLAKDLDIPTTSGTSSPALQSDYHFALPVNQVHPSSNGEVESMSSYSRDIYITNLFNTSHAEFRNCIDNQISADCNFVTPTPWSRSEKVLGYVAVSTLVAGTGYCIYASWAYNKGLSSLFNRISSKIWGGVKSKISKDVQMTGHRHDALEEKRALLPHQRTYDGSHR